MSKILVSGGAGFIGAHVSNRLAKEGHQVTVIDDFNDYYDPSLKRARQKDLLIPNNIRVFEEDISNLNKLELIFEEENFDKVCHLAAQAGVRHSIDNPLIYATSNYMGTLHMLELCRQFNIKDFVFASSSSVYGASKKVPFSEEDRTDNPISFYAATKKATEEMAFAYSHLYQINCTGLRFFTVYGPYGRPDMAPFMFTKDIIEEKEIAVFNNGDLKRDFTYIDDIVDGVILSLNKPFHYEIFNLGRSQPVPLMDFINEIELATGKTAKKKMLPMQPGDVPITYADTSKAQRMLTYSPKTNIREGVSKFVSWYKNFYSEKTPTHHNSS